METKELISTYRPNCDTANLKVEEIVFALHSINLQGFISVTLIRFALHWHLTEKLQREGDASTPFIWPLTARTKPNKTEQNSLFSPSLLKRSRVWRVKNLADFYCCIRFVLSVPVLPFLLTHIFRFCVLYSTRKVVDSQFFFSSKLRFSSCSSTKLNRIT